MSLQQRTHEEVAFICGTAAGLQAVLNMTGFFPPSADQVMAALDRVANESSKTQAAVLLSRGEATQNLLICRQNQKFYCVLKNFDTVISFAAILKDVMVGDASLNYNRLDINPRDLKLVPPALFWLEEHGD